MVERIKTSWRNIMNINIGGVSCSNQLTSKKSSTKGYLLTKMSNGHELTKKFGSNKNVTPAIRPAGKR
ncbi:hypothetical protein BpHYR1_040156 [Brachionus plicatilis]|uniref:Uncharacterized protein n=1 Tax=Brachionus plicatilis TaxID=10195 RepID=A0A3M7SJG6_BRAPC|nr:hypothetical protein BpHYR1_040156 [Brachionus plicatilis]